MTPFLRTAREKTVAIVDVGRGSTHIAIVRMVSGQPVQIIASEHAPLTLETRTPEQSLAIAAQEIAEVGGRVLDVYAASEKHPAIHEVYVVMHAPWVTTHTVSKSVKYAKEVIVHDSLIAKMAQESLAGDPQYDRTTFFEAAVTQICLNGYPTESPEGIRAHDVRISSIVSSADQGAYKILESAVRKVFPGAPIVWRSGVRTLLRVLHATRPSMSDYLLVDMGADATHMTSVRDGEIGEHRVVDAGVRSILAKIGGGRLPDETLTHIRMLARDACEGAACEEIQKSLVVVEPELVKACGDAIGQLASVKHVPNTLILLTHADLADWLGKFLARIDFAQFTVTAVPFEADTIAADELRPYVSGEAESNLAVAAAFVNIESTA